MLFASGGAQTSLRLTDASSSKIWNYFTEKQKQWNQQEDEKTAALLQGRIEFLIVSSIQGLNWKKPSLYFQSKSIQSKNSKL